ncbi:MAG: hypothetical protein COA58_11485 [Bacteroidetes bacterium]|nr:MAG: hypothetical protein COA58_11485 [Bacteroidota bacterium]
MPLTETTHNKAIAFLEMIQIGHEIMKESSVVNSKTKELFNNSDTWNIKTINESLEKRDLSHAGLESLIGAYLTFWNESVGMDIEEFWIKINKKSLDFKRKDPLKYALDKGRFRNVHQGMSARRDWNRLKESQLLNKRLTKEEIECLDIIIKDDELERVKLLKKCLTKKSIPKTQYLKFGDCIGYLSHCDLFENYFTELELEELHEVWNNFESK